jgi:diguanylate cyclase (GGDEF)-like protein
LLLSGAFLVLGAIAVFRVIGSRDPIDIVPAIVVVLAAIAAIGHRNAVVGLETRGRSEAESFARILRGLSRTVSADAVVAAIMDDLVDTTGADHVVVVRRRQDGTALEATLVTRRTGVPTTSTILPVADLDAPLESPPPGPGVAVGPGLPPLPPVIPATAAATQGAPAGDVAVASTTRPFVRRVPPTAGSPFSIAAPYAVDAPAVSIPAIDVHAGVSPYETAPSARPRGPGERVLAEAAALLRDLGVPLPPGGRDIAPIAEVVGSGVDAAVAERIAHRVRTVFGLAQTLATPLRTDQGLIGAIVLSRRDREPWSNAERRLLRGAATEASNALVRAVSRREAEALAATDGLTGLPNRRYFDEFCSLLAKRRRSGDAVAVLMIDIDRFKVLNDTYGHPVGDEVLKRVAAAIVSAVRDHDVPARVGGEEFAVVLRNPGTGIALEVGERVRAAVQALDLSATGVPSVSVSVGVANALGPDELMADVVGRADKALLRAKRTGRDRVVAA